MGGTSSAAATTAAATLENRLIQRDKVPVIYTPEYNISVRCALFVAPHCPDSHIACAFVTSFGVWRIYTHLIPRNT
jgi:hypothetical protein